MLHSGWLIPSWLIEQSLPLTSFSQIKRDLSKKHKSRDILRGLAVKRNQMIDPSSSIINTIRRTSAESYIGSYQKRSLLSEHLFFTSSLRGNGNGVSITVVCVA